MPIPIPFSVLAKPTGAACNLDCTYCFFLSKEALYDADSQRMDDRTLTAYLENLIGSHPDGEVVVGWQGGEPMLRGLDFYRRAVAEAQRLRRPGQRIVHTMQTNATLVDPEWAAFLADHDFLVGVSIDGPARLHDAYRVNKAGRATYSQVRRGWDLLQTAGVQTNVLCSVHAANEAHPSEVYRHLRDELGARYLQLIPIVERVPPGLLDVAERGWARDDGRRVLYRQHGSAVASRSVSQAGWGVFLRTIFDEWVSQDVGTVFVQHFDVMLSNLLGAYTLCVHAPECGSALAVEHNGDTYSCDHYVEPGYRLGNVTRDSFPAMLGSAPQRAFGAAKRTTLPAQCVRCPVRWACHGGCPKDRFATTADGEPGLNHLCAGYFDFFSHAQPGIEQMARLLQAGRSPTEIMPVDPTG